MLPLATLAISTVLAATGLTAAAASPAPAADPGCSSDAFPIDGSTVLVQLCAADSGKASAAKTLITETLSVKGQPPLVRNVPVERVPGADASRTIDDVPLAALGLSRTLHLTIAVKNGNARLEHALLIPGAVALK
jgi:hypothetical protein